MSAPSSPLPPDPEDVVAEIERPFTLHQPALQVVPVRGRRAPCRAALSRAPSSTRRGCRCARCAAPRTPIVDRLFAARASISARRCWSREFPRAYLDVNREPYELDPRMFDGRLPAFANTRSMRVAGGLGTIPRIVGDAQEIYLGRIPVEEALSRIDGLYRPYHAGAAQPGPAHAGRVRHLHPGRCAFDAVDRARPRRAGQARHHPRRPLRHQRGRLHHRHRRRRLPPARASA